MKARLRKFIAAIDDTFWIIPGTIVRAVILLATGLLHLDRSGAAPD